AGGERRQDSVLRGLASLDAACDIVVIHDGARPLIRPNTVSRVVEAAREFGAAIAAVPVKDTIKVVRGCDVVGTMDRETLWAAATPQAFQREIIESGYERAVRDGLAATDDAMLVEGTGVAVKVVPGEYDNIKITTPEDLVIAEALLAARDGSRPERRQIRVGLGFDVHRLVPGRRLVLGGVTIPFGLGLEGHSDADVMLHAVADAILGACALGDIGRLFPDDDTAYAGISSTVILEKVRDLAKEAGFAVNNVDVMLLAERPKISGFVPEMREVIARVLCIPVDQVSIKATTMEGMGFVGSGAGMACYASCSVTVNDGGRSRVQE
ncbi:MAG: 2-C-methyl-D-erythritol 2,4-cyclodiphosphate synthase, partial [Bacillota bacterium]